MKERKSRPKKTAKGRTRVQKEGEPVPRQSVQADEPVHFCDDVHARISRRAYELHLIRGQQGCALDDWLEAEREILSREPPV